MLIDFSQSEVQGYITNDILKYNRKICQIVWNSIFKALITHLYVIFYLF